MMKYALILLGVWVVIAVIVVKVMGHANVILGLP
jgi:hypothetical protein